MVYQHRATHEEKFLVKNRVNTVNKIGHENRKEQ